jgi:phospholipid/cholesterol/gamma-HCH transport system substrate-binding protein
MPRTRSLVWSELKLGVLTIAALAIAAITIFLVMGGTGFFWQRYPLKTRFDNVAGLKPGSPVRLAGVEVGSVSNVVLTGTTVEVWFEVNNRYQPEITTASVARLGSVSLLGEAAVDITPSAAGTAIPEWGYVPSDSQVASLSDVTSQASQSLADLSGLVHDVRTGRGTVGKLMTDDSLYVELERFVTSAGDVTRSIKAGQGTLGKFIDDPAMAASLERTLSSLDEMTRRINAGEGSIGRLMTDDSFAQSLQATTANLSDITGKLSRGEGTAGRLLQDDALYQRLDSLTERFDTLLTRLNSGEGTMGQLLQDEKLYENMNAAVADFRSLLTEIRNDPKKYLNVKISIF